jgi:hypothetical protein
MTSVLRYSRLLSLVPQGMQGVKWLVPVVFKLSGKEPMTTMTVQIPERLKHALKQTALDRKTTVKALLIEMIEGHLAASKQ